MDEKQPSRTLASMMLGPTFMSQVRALNKQAVKINLRTTLGYFPDNRDVPPELVKDNPEYSKRVASADPIAPIDKKWYYKPVAIIGAGAAGLCAEYELMRSGIMPVFFEMQRDPDSTGPARAGGRAHSINLSDNNQPPVLCDLGCMRFPKNHTTLRTYADEVFKNDYKYRYPDTEKWVPLLDPLLFDGTGDIPQSDWKVVYDTVRQDAAVFFIGEATAWLGLSGLIEGALHTGINATDGVGDWFSSEADNFKNWNKVTNPNDIDGTMFAPITTPVGTAD